MLLAQITFHIPSTTEQLGSKEFDHLRKNLSYKYLLSINS